MLDEVKVVAGIMAAVVGVFSGVVTLSGKLGFEIWSRPILEWAPEQFDVVGGPADEGFRVVAARKKLRDDCEVVGFTVEVRDSDFIVFPATPSAMKFSGAASDVVEKFGYYVFLHEMDVHKVRPGVATLLGQIKYRCPEGEKIVTYPSGLEFEILPAAPLS
jgi:hypothetical protein